jgi:hypothetical protein
MIVYVFGTWVLANLLHPAVMFLYFGNAGEFFDVDGMYAALQLFLYSLLFSLPALLMSIAIVYGINKLSANPTAKFWIWLMAGPFIALFNFILILFILVGSDWHLYELEIGIPAMISIILTVLLRNRAFFKMTYSLKPKENENNLV